MPWCRPSAGRQAGPAWCGSAQASRWCWWSPCCSRSAALPEVPSQDDPAEPDELINAWHEDAYLLAMLMLAPMLLAGVSSVSGAMVAFLTGSTPDWLATVSTNNASVAIGRLLQAGFAGVLAWRRARSGDRVAPMVLGAYATIMTLSAAAVGTGWRWLTWEPEPVGVLLLVGLLGALVTRGNRPAGLQHGLVLVLLVSLYRFREVLSEPGTVFATASATGVLLISLLWRVLTDGELARGDSRQFPHASRILVYATMSLLAVVSLAISAQVRVEGSALDQTSMMAYGDRTLGGALFFAAGLAALAALRRTTGHPAEEPLFRPRPRRPRPTGHYPDDRDAPPAGRPATPHGWPAVPRCGPPRPAAPGRPPAR